MKLQLISSEIHHLNGSFQAFPLRFTATLPDLSSCSAITAGTPDRNNVPDRENKSRLKAVTNLFHKWDWGQSKPINPDRAGHTPLASFFPLFVPLCFSIRIILPLLASRAAVKAKAASAHSPADPAGCRAELVNSGATGQSGSAHCGDMTSVSGIYFHLRFVLVANICVPLSSLIRLFPWQWEHFFPPPLSCTFAHRTKKSRWQKLVSQTVSRLVAEPGIFLIESTAWQLGKTVVVPCLWTERTRGKHAACKNLFSDLENKVRRSLKLNHCPARAGKRI